MQASGGAVTAYEVGQPRLVYRYFAGLESGYLFGIDVHTGNVDTHLGEACSRNESYISCAYDCYVHLVT